MSNGIAKFISLSIAWIWFRCELNSIAKCQNAIALAFVWHMTPATRIHHQTVITHNWFSCNMLSLSLSLSCSLCLHSCSGMQQSIPRSRIAQTACHDKCVRCELSLLLLPCHLFISLYRSWKSKKSVNSFSMPHPQTAFVRIQQTVQFPLWESATEWNFSSNGSCQ